MGKFWHFCCIIVGVSFISQGKAQELIDLSGNWAFQMDPMDFERAFENSGAHKDKLNDYILLPGTTDSNWKGVKTTSTPVNRLSRLFEFSGPAWYQREVVIPQSWDGKSIELFLERVLWVSSIYIDGSLVGEYRSFSTPHRFELAEYLSPGVHRISICVDNRVPLVFDRWSHAFSEYTQTAWNGIVGRIELRAKPSVHISDLQVYPDVDRKTARVVCTVENPDRININGDLHFFAETGTGRNYQKTAIAEARLTGNEFRQIVTVELRIGNNMQVWDEFHPALYALHAELNSAEGTDTLCISFGMRKYSTEGSHFMVNNKRIFLRGTLECAIFPLTGYPDMSVEGWSRICRIVKEYGLNHIRFHSWCPPEAAFTAADQQGIYLQVELPAWTEMGSDSMLNQFFREELDRVLKSYGNHPSFVQLCIGNELRGNFDYMADLIRDAQIRDPRHLYSGSTARKHLPEDQYYVSHVSSAGGITTYGARGPQTDYDLRKNYAVLNVPGVAHELGQRAVYPNFEEIGKYTGVLYPRNFELFRDTLKEHGMLNQAGDFFRVSGQMTAMLYKESIEALLRTPNCGGFQMLDLHDFPGQGTALVGILDPFWDSKGIIPSEKFREFCSSTVPILRLPKRTYFLDEHFSATAELYHYGADNLPDIQASWEVRTMDNQRVAGGKFRKHTIIQGTLDSLGIIQCTFKGINKAQKLSVSIDAGTGIHNSWEIWVYPRLQRAISGENYLVSKNLDSVAMRALEEGRRVLLLPDIRQLEGKQPDFQNHFWCPVMFRWEPMNMGALVNINSKAFSDFPTEYFTSWQWWDIIQYSKTIILEGTPQEFTSLLQIIDSYDRCWKQGVIFEARVGNGKLLMAAIDFEKNIEARPAAKQLLYSLEKYIGSSDFNPGYELKASYLAAKFKKPNLLTGAKIILADSYETGNEPYMAIDDDPTTIWHTSYSSPGNFAVTNKQAETDYPHEIQIELPEEVSFSGFTYVPRSDGKNGRIAQYALYISGDGKDWGFPVITGSFNRDADPKDVKFDRYQRSKFIRFVALKGFEGQKWTSVAEIRLIP